MRVFGETKNIKTTSTPFFWHPCIKIDNGKRQQKSREKNELLHSRMAFITITSTISVTYWIFGVIF